MKKAPLAGGLLIASVVVWGIWTGGQLYVSLMTVPMFTDSVAAMQTYFQLPRHGSINFFLVFGPPVITLGIIGPLAAWRSTKRARKWLVCSIVCALLVSGMLFFTVQSIGLLIDQGLAGSQSAETIASGLARWKIVKNIRLIFELLGFFASVMALRIWAEE